MELIQEADRSKWMVHSNHSIRCFTQGDIERMTNDYRTSLGRGAFGEVVENINNVYAFSNALTRGVRGVREMLDVDIASKNNLKVLDRVAKLAGECLRMDRDKRPEMIGVAERLRVLRKSSYQDQERQRVDLFSWVKKSIPAAPALVNMSAPPALANILPSEVCRRFSFEEMKSATNNFDKLLLVGDGGYGRVYCGQINGRKTNVAIKCIYNYKPDCHPQHVVNAFNTEIEIMSKHRHRHLVPLIGYCNEEGAMILVYDYMARGSLHDHLHGAQKLPLTWKQRIEICIGAAPGLNYLHEQQTIHHDLTMRKILLDEEWVAKITDLSLSRTGPSFETRVRATYGYADPEYVRTGWLSEKSDVYSFGVVLFEVLCAQPALVRSKQFVLRNWALQCKEEGNLDQITDPYLRGRINPWSLNKFVETAVKCLADKGHDRPWMGDVLSDIECALELLQDASGEASSGNTVVACNMWP